MQTAMMSEHAAFSAASGAGEIAAPGPPGPSPEGAGRGPEDAGGWESALAAHDAQTAARWHRRPQGPDREHALAPVPKGEENPMRDREAPDADGADLAVPSVRLETSDGPAGEAPEWTVTLPAGAASSHPDASAAAQLSPGSSPEGDSAPPGKSAPRQAAAGPPSFPAMAEQVEQGAAPARSGASEGVKEGQPSGSLAAPLEGVGFLAEARPRNAGASLGQTTAIITALTARLARPAGATEMPTKATGDMDVLPAFLLQDALAQQPGRHAQTAVTGGQPAAPAATHPRHAASNELPLSERLLARLGRAEHAGSAAAGEGAVREWVQAGRIGAGRAYPELSASAAAEPAVPATGARVAAAVLPAGEIFASPGSAGGGETVIGGASDPGLLFRGHAAPGSLPPVRTDPAMARQVAVQIGEVLRPQPGGPVELSLHPEELGRLRLSFSGGEGALHVTVAAERPETLEMMRRHIDLLALELRRMGQEGAQFSFAAGDNAYGRSAGKDAEAEVPGRPEEGDAAATAGAPPAQRAQVLDASGLDLRV